MANFVCKTPTYWRERMWNVGDVYTGTPKDQLQKEKSEGGPDIVPWHFEALVEPVAAVVGKKNAKGAAIDEY